MELIEVYYTQVPGKYNSPREQDCSREAIRETTCSIPGKRPPDRRLLRRTPLKFSKLHRRSSPAATSKKGSALVFAGSTETRLHISTSHGKKQKKLKNSEAAASGSFQVRNTEFSPFFPEGWRPFRMAELRTDRKNGPKDCQKRKFL